LRGSSRSRFDDLAAISYRIGLLAGIEESAHETGSATVIVKPNESTTVTIVVQVR
jgi:hypothetical protein